MSPFGQWFINCEKLWEKYYIYVSDVNKKKGIGRKLIDKLENELKQDGATTFQIKVYSFNKEMYP